MTSATGELAVKRVIPLAVDMRTLKITLAYDGTRFVGWQRQADGDSIQGLLEDALARLRRRRRSRCTAPAAPMPASTRSVRSPARESPAPTTPGR